MIIVSRVVLEARIKEIDDEIERIEEEEVEMVLQGPRIMKLLKQKERLRNERAEKVALWEMLRK